MGTNSRGEGSYSDGSKILSQDPQFFKVILFPPDQGLTIPDAFMRKYRRNLQDVVLLKVPTGVSWRVELVHYGDRTLLQKGWEEFSKFYSIKKFHFLVFRYKGNSQFHVFIFDPSALEIDYPVKANCDRSDGCFQTSRQRRNSCVRTKLETSECDEEFEEISAEALEKNFQTAAASKGKRARVEDTEENVSIEILDDLSKCKPKNRYSHKRIIENPRMNVVRASTNSFYHTRSRGNENVKINQDGNSAGKSSVGTRRSLKRSTSISNFRTVTDKEKFKSYEKAKAFTCSNPFFLSFMQPSYVSNKFSLEIPREFARKYLPKDKKRQPFTFNVSGRRISWPVTVNVLLQHSGEAGRTRVSAGWKKFVLDNSLCLGDVCVFELVPGTRKFNVTKYS